MAETVMWQHVISQVIHQFFNLKLYYKMDGQIVKKAENDNKIVGLGKWLYYMTLAWALEPKKAEINWQLTKSVWQKC